MLELQSWLAKPHPLATVPALLLGLQLQSAPGLSHPLGLVAPPGISAEGEQLLVLRAAYSQDLAQLQAQHGSQAQQRPRADG
ncbi:hypothetical protein T492DRAFT_895801 [Pavlovales sp. CCMP2436]|nr:hypothetical protein T492DRAFT_895801 [Pavlovales sp. CCMP2436]